MEYVNEKLNEFNDYIRFRKVAVIGMGVSNLPLLDYLYEKKANVTIFDEKDLDSISNDIMEKIREYGFQFHFGENCLEYLKNFNLIFRSPSCLPTRKELEEEAKRGAIVTTEIELLMKMCPCKIVGVTGSDGKTTTTSLINAILKHAGYNTFLGGNIGTPLFTRLNEMKPSDVVVLELSSFQLMNMEISPNISVITNIGTSHIGNLGSRENILKAKLEILEGLSKDGYVVINNDNDLLHKWVENQNTYKVITYGIKSNSKYVAQNIEYLDTTSNYNVKVDENLEKITVTVGGEAFIYNSLAALSVGRILNIPIEKIKHGIEKFELSKMRLDIQKTKDGHTIINDCYNANYDSMKSSLEYLNRCEGKRKIAILGDMLELGDYAKELHEKVGIEVAKNNIDILITVGKEAKNIANKAQQNGVKQVYICENNKLEKL